MIVLRPAGSSSCSHKYLLKALFISIDAATREGVALSDSSATKLERCAAASQRVRDIARGRFSTVMTAVMPRFYRFQLGPKERLFSRQST